MKEKINRIFGMIVSKDTELRELGWKMCYEQCSIQELEEIREKYIYSPISIMGMGELISIAKLRINEREDNSVVNTS